MEGTMNTIQKKRGQYLGTEIDHKWWQRYSEEGFFTRGTGEYWIKDGTFYFQHQVRQKPIKLPLQDIVEIALHPCNRRTKIGVMQIIELVWQKDGLWLSSSFALPGSIDEVNGLLTCLRAGT
jgi:hypothetical protein